MLSEIFIGEEDGNKLAIRTDMSGIKINEIEITPFKSDKASKVALRKLKRERNQFFSSISQELDFDIRS